MARKQRRTKRTAWLWYGLYAVAGYYGYTWFKQYQMNQAQLTATTTVVPTGTQR